MTPNTNAPACRFRLPALTLALLAIAAPTRAQDADLPKAEEVLAKYIEATGGEAAYKALRTRKITGTIEFVGAGISGDLEIWQQAPDKMKTVLNLENVGTVEQGTDGQTAWERNPITGDRLLDGTEKAAFLRQAAFNADLMTAELFDKVETTAKEDVDGTPCYVVVLTPAEGEPETRYYEVESGLMLKSKQTVETPMGAIPVESLVSDYREVDGIKVPFKSTEKLVGQEIQTTLDKVEHGVEIPEDAFEVPEGIKQDD